MQVFNDEANDGSFSRTFNVKTALNKEVTFKLSLKGTTNIAYVDLSSEGLGEPIFDNLGVKSQHLEMILFNSCAGAGGITLSQMGGDWLSADNQILFCTDVD